MSNQICACCGRAFDRVRSEKNCSPICMKRYRAAYKESKRHIGAGYGWRKGKSAYTTSKAEDLKDIWADEKQHWRSAKKASASLLERLNRFEEFPRPYEFNPSKRNVAA